MAGQDNGQYQEPTIAEPVSCAIIRRRKGEEALRPSSGRSASMKNGVPY